MSAQLTLVSEPRPADTAAGQRLLALRAQVGTAAALRAACEDMAFRAMACFLAQENEAKGET